MAYDKIQLLNNIEHYMNSAEDLTNKAGTEGRLLTESEQNVLNDLLNKAEAAKEQLEAIKKHEASIEKLEQVRASAASVSRLTRPEQPASTKVAATYKRHSSIKNFKGVGAEEKAYRSGMWLRATLYGDQSAHRWCANHGVYNALGENSNNTGGYLVPEEFSNAIIDLREQYGVFRKECRVVPMGSDTLLVPRRNSGVSVAFVGENPTSAIAESTPDFSQVRLTAKKLAGMVRMSTEVAEDAVIDLADWVAGELAYEFALKEDQCGFNGDGTSTYGGIQGVTQKILGLAGAVDAASGHNTFAEIDSSDLSSLMAKLPAYARPGAKWYCSTVAFDLVFGRLMIGAGGNTIGNLESGYQPRYLGYPIVLSQVLPTSTGDLENSAMLLFGDMSKAVTMGDRRGIRMLASEQRYMEYDQIAIQATERFDINCHDLGTASVVGPLVALVGN